MLNEKHVASSTSHCVTAMAVAMQALKLSEVRGVCVCVCVKECYTIYCTIYYNNKQIQLIIQYKHFKSDRHLDICERCFLCLGGMIIFKSYPIYRIKMG